MEIHEKFREDVKKNDEQDLMFLHNKLHKIDAIKVHFKVNYAQILFGKYFHIKSVNEHQLVGLCISCGRKLVKRLDTFGFANFITHLKVCFAQFLDFFLLNLQ